ncbi:MAG: integrase core domain-containing protein [Candidatus Hydrogenedentales bacterium]
MLKRKRLHPEQILRKLQDADRLLNAGKSVEHVCQALEVRRSFTADAIVGVLSDLMAAHGVPCHIRSDTGSEFIAVQMQTWYEKISLGSLYVAPGAPWRNGYVESFNSHFRDEFLAMNYFTSLKDAQQLSMIWKVRYNETRLHFSLGNRPPKEFAEGSALMKHRNAHNNRTKKRRLNSIPLA